MSASNTDPAADDPVSDDNVSDAPRLEYPAQDDTDGDEDDDGDGYGDGGRAEEGDEAGEDDKAGEGNKARDGDKDDGGDGRGHGHGDGGRDGQGDEDVPDESSAPSAPSAAAEASTQQDSQAAPVTSVIDALPIETIHPLFRVLIVAISGTLPSPADKWEMSIWERLIRKNMLTIAQGSEKPGFSLNHEGLKCEFIYDIRGDDMLMRTWGGFDADMRVLSGMLEQKIPLKKGSDNLFALHPGTFRIRWKGRGQNEPASELELRLLKPRYRIKKYHVRHGIAQPEQTRKGRHPLTSLRVRHGLDIKPVDVSATERAFNRDMYKLQMKQQLHRSSHSIISSVEHSRYGSIIAKVVYPGHGTSGLEESESQQRKWIREMQAMKGLDHPSIMKLLGCDSRLSALYMQRKDSPSLIEAVSGRFHIPGISLPYHFTGNRADARKILKKLASALKYLDQQQIIHNNVKVGNILWDQYHGPTLIDFGTATRHGAPVSHGGKCYYVPPEYYDRHHQRRGKEGDVFALGVVMLWLLKKMSLPDKDDSVPSFKQHRAWNNGRQHDVLVSSAWLSKVNSLRSKLDHSGTEGIVRDMLEPCPEERISAARLKAKAKKRH